MEERFYENMRFKSLYATGRKKSQGGAISTTSTHHFQVENQNTKNIESTNPSQKEDQKTETIEENQEQQVETLISDAQPRDNLIPLIEEEDDEEEITIENSPDVINDSEDESDDSPVKTEKGVLKPPDKSEEKKNG